MFLDSRTELEMSRPILRAKSIARHPSKAMMFNGRQSRRRIQTNLRTNDVAMWRSDRHDPHLSLSPLPGRCGVRGYHR